MSKSTERTEPAVEDLKTYKILVDRKERLWRQLQSCFDLIKGLPNKEDVFITRVKLLETNKIEFQNVLDQLAAMCVDHEDFIIDTVQLSTSYDDLFYAIMTCFHGLPRFAQSPGQSTAAQTEARKRVKRPEINIEKFDGSPEKFPSFIALFDSLIHTSDLSEIEKFSYLMSYLQGPALRLIQTFTLSPENYLNAYNLLVKRFTNKRIRANHYISRILNLNNLKNDSPHLLQEFVDTLQTNVVSLRSLNIPNLDEYLIMEYSLRLLDSKSRKDFETKYLEDDWPSLEDLISFLRDKCVIAELMCTSASMHKSVSSTPVKDVDRKRVHIAVERTSQNKPRISCPLCKEDHKMIGCKIFTDATPRDRYELVKKHRRCFACLGTHSLAECSSQGSCRLCGTKKHNSLLHFDTSHEQQIALNSNSNEPVTSPANADISSFRTVHSCSVSPSLNLLGTLQVLLFDSAGRSHKCRALLDSGSQVNLISLNLADALGLRRVKSSHTLGGVALTTLGRPHGLVSCTMTSIHGSKSSDLLINFDALILPRITVNLPSTALVPSLKERFSHLELADPDFDRSSPVDLLLGVSVCDDITPPFSQNIKGNPSALLTTFGWVIRGSLPDDALAHSVLHSVTTSSEEPSIDTILRSFWETEEIPSHLSSSPDNDECEKYFRNSFSRDTDGRYVVRLPFKDGKPPIFTSNRAYALRRFHKLEFRFNQDPTFRDLYISNIREYVSQGHLIPAAKSVPYILTHHGVVKRTSAGTSVRVVFNPAEKDAGGLSLNETLLSGPKLQADIGLLITRFRLPQIAITCDIKQMFREIKVHVDDCQYQHILWRFSPEDPITEWEHTRVIFGATSSPYLAQRSLQQLVQDEGDNYPLAAIALKKGRYVDDILDGADDEPNAKLLCEQLTKLLSLGGYQLGKWASSSDHIISHEYSTTQNLPTTLSSVKILGLAWNPKEDIFHYRLHSSEDAPTKRGILSRIARIFDINGYLCPFTFKLKSLLQRLWLLKLDWDDNLPLDISLEWNNIVKEFSLIEDISIPRCIIAIPRISARLIGFSDASQAGMAAVIYLRVMQEESIMVNLVVAKSRVAPLKSWTIPRLELGAAWLLSKLLQATSESFTSIDLETPICMTDSTVTLAWIKTPPHLLKTFVANRVSQIHEQSPNAKWYHVAGSLNPADPASRGLSPAELAACTLWWEGPDFLHNPLEKWPVNLEEMVTEIPETKHENLSMHSLLLDPLPFEQLFERVSSLHRLQRILAYVRRYVYNLKSTVCGSNSKQCSGTLNPQEYADALTLAVRITQAQHLGEEVQRLENGRLCSKRYRSFSPFLDHRGLLAVGGRLKFSKLSQDSRHPILIPPHSRLATLLIDHFHLITAHGGPQAIQSLLHRKFWIPSARSIIRQRIFRCLKCYRFKADPIQPTMADLPAYRLQPSRAFTHTGLDFAGPFQIKAAITRSNKVVKCYLALFICMVTKAIHLEAVTDLSSERCLAAIDRFIARRGLPSNLYSDQGRNFRGAARELNEITKFLHTSSESFAHYLASRNISWNFNPPYAPNFGGLWEAGVKSFKHHFRRVIGEQILSLEEFYTVIARIEAILNSRPLCPLSNSPDDGFDYLTPGHFLIGGPILSRPEIDLSDEPHGHLKRWQMARQLVQSFWRRWSNEYLHTQLQRPKWVSGSRQLSVGDLVFWSKPGMLPTQWPRGRVVQLIPGADGIPRVARVKTCGADVIRPINKLIPLPPN